jgi:hypothetical protein
MVAYVLRRESVRRTGFIAAASLWLVLVLICGCNSSDLPSGWGNARKIANFTQMECSGSPFDGPAESIKAQGRAGAIDIDYQHAPFRCAQDVEGFVRRSPGHVDILVQPVDMDPRSVAKCDCLYDIVATVSAEAGEQAVTVYRRSDNINSDNDPVSVGSMDVVVPAGK